jgi:hypothetical protein
MFQILSGLGALNIGSGRYFSAAESEPRVMDGGYEPPSCPESPNLELMPNLGAAQERVRTPAPELTLDNRPYPNGSPMTMRTRPLQLVTARTSSFPGMPALPSVLSRSNSFLYANPSVTNGNQNVVQTRENTQGASTFEDSGVSTSNTSHDTRASTPSFLRVARNERLGHQTLAPPFSTPPLAQVRRRLVFVAAEIPVQMSLAQYQQYPVSIRAADRNSTNSPDSMRGQNDTSAYQKHSLGRRHIHPPLTTEWANVPTADQNLVSTNSRAMMDTDRFAHAIRTAMPVLPQQTGDTLETVADRSLTPNSKAKKTEKDAQKRLRKRI